MQPAINICLLNIKYTQLWRTEIHFSICSPFSVFSHSWTHASQTTSIHSNTIVFNRGMCYFTSRSSRKHCLSAMWAARSIFDVDVSLVPRSHTVTILYLFHHSMLYIFGDIKQLRICIISRMNILLWYFIGYFTFIINIYTRIWNIAYICTIIITITIFFFSSSLLVAIVKFYVLDIFAVVFDGAKEQCECCSKLFMVNETTRERFFILGFENDWVFYGWFKIEKIWLMIMMMNTAFMTIWYTAGTKMCEFANNKHRIIQLL